MSERKITIYGLLSTGRKHSLTINELSQVTGLDARTIKRIIEKERREGYPIAAITSGRFRGYYKPTDRAEMMEYCGRLKNRIKTLQETLRCSRLSASKMK